MVIRHLAGEALRGLATLLTLAAERVDPQPQPDPWREVWAPCQSTSSRVESVFYRAPRTWHKTG